MKDISTLLTEAGVPHYNCGNVPGAASDFGLAATLCTVCNIASGNISIDEALSGKLDLVGFEACMARAEQWSQKYKNERRLRELGYKKWHTIAKVIATGDVVYERYSCHKGSGASGPVKEDRICFSCKGSIDE